MDMTINCHDVEIASTGMNTHALRVTLREVNKRNLDNPKVYDSIDVKAFCEHHSLELKEK